MPVELKARKENEAKVQRGFSLLEMMVSMVILLGVTGVVMSGMLQSSQTESSVENRTEMHAGVRSATELLQQEIGQAGRVSLPQLATPVQLTAAVAVGANQPASVTTGAGAGIYQNEYLVVDAGSNQETVQVASISGDTFNATFGIAHALGAPVTVQGGFGTGVVPNNVTNGSDKNNLKLYGDINGDGNMVYVQYICDYASSGNLYRSVTSFSAGTIVAKQVLLPNLVKAGNPGGTPCFDYQIKCSIAGCFVVDVAVTLTVQTQQLDAFTGKYQQETKALLNVSPRNVFEAYQLSTLSNNRVQPTPATITSLMSQTP